MLLPQYGANVLRVVIVTIAAAVALYALGVAAPRAWWTSPFERMRRGKRDALGADEVTAIRASLSGRRQRLRDGPLMPAEALRLLRPLILLALERQGLDMDDECAVEAAPPLVAPMTWAILKSDPLPWPRWHQTRRPNERDVAEVVHTVLDDLDRLASGGGGRSPHADLRSPNIP